jgi:hypothetical protein
MSGRMKIGFVVLAAAFVVAALAPVGAGAVEPSRWSLASHWGSNVDMTKVQASAPQAERNICTVLSGDVCQPGALGHEAGGFFFPASVAVAPDGDVYVAEGGANRRVQEFTASGEFVLMFGFKVNKKGGDLCTKAEEQECEAGQAGTGLAGQLGGAESIAVDQASGNVYVLEGGVGKDRVEEFTSTGSFVLMIGREVNKNHANLCTEVEESECQGGRPGAGQGEFEPLQADGDLLAVGPTDHLLYVGDHSRVQEFEASGEWVGEFSTRTAGAWVSALAVDKSGEAFVVEAEASGPRFAGVHEYGAGAWQSCVIDPSSASIFAIAIDAYGRLGLLKGDRIAGETPQGAVYKIGGGECGTKLPGSEFGPLAGNMPPEELAFNVSEPAEPLSDRMYLGAVGEEHPPQEIVEYAPASFPEARTLPASGVSATGAALGGEIDPNGLLATGFFAYGTEEGKLTDRTGKLFKGEQDAFQMVSTSLSGLIPNQRYWYAMAVEAQVGGGREVGYGPEVLFHTSTPAPEVPGMPVASFVTGQSVVFTATVNPQHAPTRYHFEYGPCEKLEGCPVIQSTPDQESSVARAVGVVQEARDLSPGSTYSYRLVADNALEYETKQEGGETTGQEGVAFTTPVIVPHAMTGSYSAVSATGAVIAGEVNPDGKPASYAFELGVFNSAGTQYGIVESGSAGEGTSGVGEELQLSGLQPGTSYAYRIKIESTYGTSYGEPVIFTTQGLPEVLPIPVTLASLPVPSIAFPKEAKVTPKTLTRAQQLKAALSVCKRKHKHARRQGCEREAHKRYGPKPRQGSGRGK